MQLFTHIYQLKLIPPTGSRKIIEKNKVELLKEQTNKIEEVLTVLRTQFGEEFEDEENYLSIVVDNLKNK